MRLTAIAAAVLAAAGDSPLVSWISAGVVNVPEFALIALWGVALVSFSARARRRRTTETKTANLQVEISETLESLGTSVPRPA